MARPHEELGEELRKGFSSSTFHSGFLKVAILRLISERPMHGYAIMKEIEKMSENTWRPSPGSVYPALQELQKAGYIVQEKVGRKRIYRLTDRGAAVLNEAMEHIRRGIRILQNILEYRQGSE